MLSTAVSAECHRSGATSSANDIKELTANRNSALRFVCASITAGAFKYGQKSKSCVLGYDGNNKFDFYVERISKHPENLELGMDDCIGYLRREIVGCPQGGVSEHGSFKYS